MIQTIFLLVVLILAFNICQPSLVRANIYKFIDDTGVIHLTNVPSRDDKRYILVWREPVRIDSRIDITKYDSLIAQAAGKYGLSKNLIRAVIRAESNYNNRAVSRAGARGLMQLMPATAASLDVHDSFHPQSNIEGGARYLRYLLDLFRGDLPLALAAYNAGTGAVIRHGNRIPPFRETQTYVRRVLSFYQEYNRGRGVSTVNNR